MPSVIIFQSTSWIIEKIEEAISQKFNLDDFVLTDEIGQVDQYIEPGKPQLFVTGATARGFAPVADLVRELREKSSDLVVVCYSLFTQAMPHSAIMPVEIVVHKRDVVNFTDLMPIIGDFKQGKLRRA